MGKKLREKNTPKKYEKKYGKTIREKKRENSTGEKNTGKKYGEKNLGKKYGGEEVWEKIVRPGRTSSGHVTLSLPVKKAPLGQIVRNFRLSMRRTHFRTWPLPVT